MNKEDMLNSLNFEILITIVFFHIIISISKILPFNKNKDNYFSAAFKFEFCENSLNKSTSY